MHLFWGGWEGGTLPKLAPCTNMGYYIYKGVTNLYQFMPTPEELARRNIDIQLNACGWVVQDRSGINLQANRGVAVREFPTNSGEADYVIFVDKKAVGVIEAKPEGTTLSAVSEQAGRYSVSLPPNIPHATLPLPFL